MNVVLKHLRSNLIGYVALFVALGGTSYAAFVLPPGSVGGAQIQNHAIAPVKFDRRLINGSVRAWASVSATGRVMAGSPKPKVVVHPNIVLGAYGITWRSVSLVGCAPIVSVDDRSVAPGFALAARGGTAAQRAEAVVNTYDFNGQRKALPFNIAVVC